MSVPYCFDYCSFVVFCKVRKHDSSRFVLLFKIVLAIWDILGFHTNFKIIFSSFVKNAIGNLIGIALNL